MTTRIFELRTYHGAPGKLEALLSRFRDHTMGLFARHGIGVVGFWSTPNPDDPSTGTLVYVCAYDSRAAADAAWAAFRDDPEWQLAKAESERDGSLTVSVESLFLEPTDFSPIR
ncbi:MAG: hypothetical protein JWM85_3014 [Acidimicrobiaceae bacterium]|nr:hypothetical protein [Acidimicrobiaceae bacterium]